MILFIPQVQRFDTRRLIMKLHQLLSLCFHYRVSHQVFDKCCDETVAFKFAWNGCVRIYLRAKHDACNCYRLISQVSSQVRLWPWIYHKNLNCRYWNEIMSATVVALKTKHTVDGRKISFGALICTCQWSKQIYITLLHTKSSVYFRLTANVCKS